MRLRLLWTKCSFSGHTTVSDHQSHQRVLSCDWCRETAQGLMLLCRTLQMDFGALPRLFGNENSEVPIVLSAVLLCWTVLVPGWNSCRRQNGGRRLAWSAGSRSLRAPEMGSLGTPKSDTDTEEMMRVQCQCLRDSRKDDDAAVPVCGQEHGHCCATPPTPPHPTPPDHCRASEGFFFALSE